MDQWQWWATFTVLFIVWQWLALLRSKRATEEADIKFGNSFSQIAGSHWLRCGRQSPITEDVKVLARTPGRRSRQSSCIGSRRVRGSKRRRTR